MRSTEPAQAAEPRRHRPRRWWRLLGLALVVLLVLGVLGLTGLRWWLGRYLHSEQFRLLVSTGTANALQADGQYLPFHWSGNVAYTDGFAARGRPDSFLQTARADQLRAEIDIAGLLEPRWRIRQLQVQRLTATLKKPTRGGTESGPLAVTGPAASRLGLDLGPIQVQELNLAWPLGDARTGAVRRVQATFERSGGDWQVSARGGELQLFPDWPSLELERARLQSRPGTVHLAEFQVRLAAGGRFEVTGELPLAGPAAADLRVTFSELPIRNWLPPDWRGALNGRAAGTARVRIAQPMGRRGLSATGTVQVLGGKLEALPILDRIALFTQTEQFRSIQLQKASAQFVWEQDQLRVEQVLLEHAGLLRIEGACRWADETLVGEFDLGVAASSLRWLPGARQRVFTVDRDGYLWTKVKIRGPLNNLQEDLSARLVNAAGEQVIDTGTSLLEQGAKTFFELLK